MQIDNEKVFLHIEFCYKFLKNGVLHKLPLTALQCRGLHCKAIKAVCVAHHFLKSCNKIHCVKIYFFFINLHNWSFEASISQICLNFDFVENKL